MNKTPRSEGPARLDRRTAIRWMLAGGAAALIVRARLLRAGMASDPAHGYGTDPDLLKAHKPGDSWPLTMTVQQRRTAGVLADLILPADGISPSASAVGVVDFIDEWVSAPYPDFVADGRSVADGLAWIEAESVRRFGVGFPDASEAQRTALCDELSLDPPSPALKGPSAFFLLFRNLAATGFYTSPEGVRDLGYVGNVPLARFDGPPPELIKKLGLEDEARSLG